MLDLSSQDLRSDAGQETPDESQLPPFTDTVLSSYTSIFYTYSMHHLVFSGC